MAVAVAVARVHPAPMALLSWVVPAVQVTCQVLPGKLFSMAAEEAAEVPTVPEVVAVVAQPGKVLLEVRVVAVRAVMERMVLVVVVVDPLLQPAVAVPEAPVLL